MKTFENNNTLDHVKSYLEFETNELVRNEKNQIKFVAWHNQVANGDIESEIALLLDF